MRPRHKIATILLFSTAPLVSGCIIDGAPADEQQMEEAPPALLELRSELLQTPPPQAVERMDYFRPLCDADGYPLVGNVANKGTAVGLQPSQFCDEVRKTIE